MIDQIKEVLRRSGGQIVEDLFGVMVLFALLYAYLGFFLRGH